MILRVFPRRTSATPEDEYVRIGPPDMLGLPPDVEAVHISVTFTWDVPKALMLFKAWREVHPKVLLGGPAFESVIGSVFGSDLAKLPGDFIPGRYLKRGYVITSRGCPNSGPHCLVALRQGSLRILPITEGWNVLDNNLLACPPAHVEAVFAMLSKQPKPPCFTGGLEAFRITPEIAAQLREIKTERLYTAFDRPDQKGAIRAGGRILRDAGFTRAHHLYCYVLIGYPGDTILRAETRLRFVWDAGFCPYAMLYRDEQWHRRIETLEGRQWSKVQKEWLRPAIIRSRAIR